MVLAKLRKILERDGGSDLPDTQGYPRPRRIIAHAHIFKNAGTTIDAILESNFGERFLDDRNDKIMAKDMKYAHQLVVDNPQLQAFSSHSLPLPFDSFANVTVNVLVMLRHPILRVKSVYDFERKQDADTPGAKFAKQADFPEYVEWRLRSDVSSTIRNMQAKYLTKRNARSITSEAQLLEEAKRQLDVTPLVGIVERFDESLKVFQDYLDQTELSLDWSYEKKNVTYTKKRTFEERVDEIRNALGDTVFDKVVAHNEVDAALYEYANQLLDKRLLG